MTRPRIIMKSFVGALYGFDVFNEIYVCFALYMPARGTLFFFF